MKEKQINLKIYQIFLSILGILIIGIWMGLVAGGFVYKDKNHLKQTPYVTENDLKEFISVFNTILNDYYEDIDKSKLIDGAISGMLNALKDPYSFYFSKDETNSFNDQMKGNYAGIGSEISINQDGKIIISKPFTNSPAIKAGLKPGDIILEVDGKSMEGLDATGVASNIKGEIGTTVNLKIERKEEILNFTITREEIIIDTVSTAIYNENNKKIGYIKIDLFAENTYIEFNKKLKELEKEKIDSLIIDVRNNSGGYLSVVTDMASLFIPKNKIIYQIESKNKTEKQYSLGKNNNRKYPIIVLINYYSASASEILAGALKESYKASLVGETTFGKGTVQTTRSLSDGSMIKYTIQRWLTPNGNSIDKTGIKPDIEISNGNEYYNNPIYDNDLQLKKAIETISK